jgi:glycerol-3-phosphate acyltransferase PlsX
VAEGDADVVVSAGNTGAMLAAGLLELRRLPGVLRPAIAVPLPTIGAPSVMLDCGANADARAEHLVQFAHMGSIFAHEILDLASPQVRLLSIGEEAEKGNQLTLDAHRILAADGSLHFAGNVESRHLLETPGQVVVCDGFTGNVCLKAVEGTILTVFGSLREQLRSTARGVLAGLLMRPARRALRERFDPDTYGGAYLLGLRHLAVIAHGNSSSHAIANAVQLAGRGVQHRVVERLAERFGEAPALAGQSQSAKTA